VPLYFEAIQVISETKGKQHFAYSKFSTNLALTYQDMNQFEKSESIFQELKEIRKNDKGTETLEYADVCNSLGTLYYRMGLYEKVLPLFLEVRRIRGKIKGKENLDYASITNNIGVIYLTMGQYKEAEPILVETKDLRLSLLGEKHPAYLQTCNNLAALYFTIKKFDKALPIFLETLEIRRKTVGEEDYGYAETCNNLGGLYEEMGLYEKAGPLLTKAKEITEKVKTKESAEYTDRCSNLAAFYRKTGQLEKSESLYLEAMAIFTKIHTKDHPDYASLCFNLAILYEDMGQYNKAEKLLTEARQILKNKFTEEHADYAASCASLGGLYANIGAYEKAEPLILEAKKIREKIFERDNPEYASSCHDLASLYLLMHKYNEAEPLFLTAKAIRLNKLGKEHPAYALTCNNLGTLYKNVGQYKSAELLYLEANQIMEKVVGKQHPDYISGYYNLANLYNVSGQTAKAINYYLKTLQTQSTRRRILFQFTSEAEKQAYIDQTTYYENALFSFYSTAKLAAGQGNPFDASISARNLVLSSSRQLKNFIYNSNDTNAFRKYDSLVNTREQLSHWYGKPIADRPEYINTLEERSNTLEKELAKLSFVFRKDQEQSEINWKDVQKKLQAKEAAIEFVSFRYFNGNRSTDSVFYIALVLRKDRSEHVMVRLFGKKQLDKIAGHSENNSAETRINSLYSKNASIYDLIWKPLEKYLAGVKKIYFAPAGELFKIPFAGLPVNNKLLLSDKYQLVQLNTTATITDDHESLLGAADKIRLYGGVQYNADSSELMSAVKLYNTRKENTRSLPADLARGGVWNYLPGTQIEISEIERLAKEKNINVQLAAGIAATEESLKSLDGKGSPAILHIATHGFFFPNPADNKKDGLPLSSENGGKVFKESDNPLLRSGLVLAGANNAWQGNPIKGIEDGILTAYEVSNLYLPGTKLVVLSACETALGDIHGSEGVYGLQRAFKMAGVQNLVMSLWQVGDKETAEFMQLFYKNLFNRQSVNDAFYNAQTIMKNKYRNEPYKWAAWVLVK